MLEYVGSLSTSLFFSSFTFSYSSVGSLGVVLERNSLMEGSLKKDFEDASCSVGVVSEHGGGRAKGPISKS